MALTSPGVQVSVIDESFYTPAEPGTVPMIFVASAQDKLNGAGTGTAAGTTKANAGKPYLLTSQRDLTETFGDPTFIQILITIQYTQENLTSTDYKQLIQCLVLATEHMLFVQTSTLMN